MDELDKLELAVAQLRHERESVERQLEEAQTLLQERCGEVGHDFDGEVFCGLCGASAMESYTGPETYEEAEGLR